jgi:dolichol-phosphate hexosyltransferase
LGLPNEREPRPSMASAWMARFRPWWGTNPILPIPSDDVDRRVPTKVLILLPALNEEGGVRRVLQAIPRTQLRRQGLACQVVLLDGHSTDRTRLIARSLGAEVFVQSGRGKGSAFREFIPKITAEVTVVLDSDWTYPPEAIPQLIGALGAGSPVILGSRFRGSRIEEGAMSRLNYLGNRLLSGLASLLFGIPISDVCSGMWAFRSDQLKSLALSAEGFELEVDIFAECALRRIPIAEIPIAYRRRVGRPKMRVRTGFRIALALLRKRVRSSLGGAVEDRANVPASSGEPTERARRGARSDVLSTRRHENRIYP